MCNSGRSLGVGFAVGIGGYFFSFSQPAGSKSFEPDAREFGFNQNEEGPMLSVKVGDKITITLNRREEEQELRMVSQDTFAVALNPSVA